MPVSGVKGVRAGWGGPRPSVVGRTKDFVVEDSTNGVIAAGEESGRKEGDVAEIPPRQAAARPAQPTLDPSTTREGRNDCGGVGINGTISSSKRGGLPGMEGRPTEGPAEAVTVLPTASRKQEHARGGGRGSRGTEACRGQEHHVSPAGDVPPITDSNNTHAETTAAIADNARSKFPNATKEKVAGVQFAAEAGDSPSEICTRACERVSVLFVEDSVEVAVVRRAQETSAAEDTACIPGALQGAAAGVGMFPSASPLPDKMRGTTGVAVAAEL